MTILEAYSEKQGICDLFDSRLHKVEAYTEASIREYNIDLEECELKVIRESGTYDDLEYLQEEASEGFIGRIKESILAIIRAFKEFCSNMKTKIINLVSKKETDDKLEKVQKKVKLNPFLSKKKVKYNDSEKEIKVHEEFMDKLKRLIPKAKRGQATTDDIDKLESDYNAALKKAVITSTAVITLAAALAIVSKRKKSAPKDVTDVENVVSQTAEAAMSGLDPATKESCAEALNATAKLASKFGKNHINSIVDGFGNPLSAIMDTVKGITNTRDEIVDQSIGSGGKPTRIPAKPKKGSKSKNLKESTEDHSDYLDSLHEELFDESTSYEDEYLDSMEDDIFGKNINESVIDDDDDDKDDYADTSTLIDNMLDF